jgi:hypothetical protein
MVYTVRGIEKEPATIQFHHLSKPVEDQWCCRLTVRQPSFAALSWWSKRNVSEKVALGLLFALPITVSDDGADLTSCLSAQRNRMGATKRLYQPNAGIS